MGWYQRRVHGNRKRFPTEKRPTCFLHRLLCHFNNKKMNFCNCKTNSSCLCDTCNDCSKCACNPSTCKCNKPAARNEQNNSDNNNVNQITWTTHVHQLLLTRKSFGFPGTPHNLNGYFLYSASAF